LLSQHSLLQYTNIINIIHDLTYIHRHKHEVPVNIQHNIEEKIYWGYASIFIEI
jgi:hypothetical protein